MTTPASVRGRNSGDERPEPAQTGAPRFGDYRDSHQNKGDDYHRLFSENAYARLLWKLERRALDQIVTSLPRTGSLSHLDFACGTGRILTHLQRYCSNSLGVDVSQSMLQVARRTAPAASFVCGDITSTALLQNLRVDLITAFRFFLNAEPQLRLAAMTKLASLLSQEGVFVFNNHRQSGSLTHRLLLRMQPARNDLHYMPHAEVLALIAASGLRVLTTYHLGVLPATEQRVALPSVLMLPLERLASKLPGLRAYANDVIYVCARA